MTVHSFHIFDRKGKTLFTKRYVKSVADITLEESKEEQEQLSEQRKLVFGMLFSLRELSRSLTPSLSDESKGPGELQMVKTGSATLYNYETVSGLRFVLYTTPETSYSTTASTEGEEQMGMTSPAVTANIRAALKHIYEHIWVTFVIRSPMYKPYDPDIKSTNFEASLDSYLKGMAWFG